MGPPRQTIFETGEEAPARALHAAGLRPNRRRGQNFLVQGAIADRIVALADPQAGQWVLEIGPGLGILSQRLLRYPIAKLWLVELDLELAARLEGQLVGNFELLREDFLQLDLSRLGATPKLKVVGNLPFNAATAMLRRLGRHRSRIEAMVLMFQREVAQRLRASPATPAYGALTLLAALDWEIGEHFRVHAGSFYPRPKVDAEVLCFRPRPCSVTPLFEQRLRALIRAGFASRRKNLRHALLDGLCLSDQQARAALNRASISPAERAEHLAMADFVRLTTALMEMAPAPACDA
ncbi:MAG TPA: 16S rRNA (adenine(1518)-N(6)/adenine(1519)-N(6))-dimethyltransferase RsmA [Candidatus Binataceae bacterium]|nr:16S rRNA (adenine(1518)-N(6)/adenine(1519)-N(6))-dimethyltransferase RsmA [Candidatus Binataceae bacterium]